MKVFRLATIDNKFLVVNAACLREKHYSTDSRLDHILSDNPFRVSRGMES